MGLSINTKYLWAFWGQPCTKPSMEILETTNKPYRQIVSLRETTDQDCEEKGAHEETRIIG